jgi:hypothetical protein
MINDFKIFQKIVYHTAEGRIFKQKQYDKIKYWMECVFYAFSIYVMEVLFINDQFIIFYFS